MPARRTAFTSRSSATSRFGATLWLSAHKIRAGALIKYTADTFEAHPGKSLEDQGLDDVRCQFSRLPEGNHNYSANIP